LAKACSIGFEALPRRVRAVGRQVEQAGASGPNCFANTGDLVGGEVVEHHHVTPGQNRREELPHVGEEGLAGHGTVQNQWRDEAGAAQARDEGGGAPVAVRRGIDQALASWAPAVAPDHVRGRAGFIQEHEAPGVHVALPDPPVAAILGDVSSVLLGRPQLLFLCD
jgi:hypothetical protein